MFAHPFSLRLAMAFSLLQALTVLGTSAAQAKVQVQDGATKAPVANCPALLNQTFKRLQDEAPQNLCQYSGKVVLVVNTASYCGFTSQYQGLETLYAKYQARGLVVLGFPSNDFGQQEPGSAKEIADFCFNTYGVKFPMFSKTVVTGPQRHAFFNTLAKTTGKTPQWNFHKYLIDRTGKVLASYPSATGPDNASLVAAIQKAL